MILIVVGEAAVTSGFAVLVPVKSLGVSLGTVSFTVFPHFSQVSFSMPVFSKVGFLVTTEV